MREYNNRKGINDPKIKLNLIKFSNPTYNVISQLCASEQYKPFILPKLFGFSCYQIVHHTNVDQYFVSIESKYKAYSKIPPKNVVSKEF